jgi:hypothetical protein
LYIYLTTRYMMSLFHVEHARGSAAHSIVSKHIMRDGLDNVSRET